MTLQKDHSGNGIAMLLTDDLESVSSTYSTDSHYVEMSAEVYLSCSKCPSWRCQKMHAGVKFAVHDGETNEELWSDTVEGLYIPLKFTIMIEGVNQLKISVSINCALS